MARFSSRELLSYFIHLLKHTSGSCGAGRRLYTFVSRSLWAILHFTLNLCRRAFSANPQTFLRLNYVNFLHAWEKTFLGMFRVGVERTSGLHLRRERYFCREGLPAARFFPVIKFNVYLTRIYIARGTDNKWRYLYQRQETTSSTHAP